MARKEILKYFDDLTGETLDEGQVEVVTFGFGRTEYEIDLSAENAAKFKAVLEPYIAVARKTSATPSRSRKSKAPAVRQWAAENGYEVSSRGKIPNTIMEAYRKAH